MKKNLNSETIKIVDYLDKIALFSIYLVIFFLPISKALIETFSYIAIACFFSKVIIERRGIKFNQITFAVFIYTLICLVSVFNTSSIKISLRVFLGKTIQEVAFYLTVIGIINSQKRIKYFLYFLFFSATLVGIDGIYQHFTHKDFLRNRPPVIIERIYASFATPNDFGSYLVTVIPLPLVLLFQRLKNNRKRIFLLGVLVLLIICLVLTVSRGAWLGFVASILFICIWLHQLILFIALFIALLLIILPFLPILLRERITNFFDIASKSYLDAGSIERQVIWDTGWRMFLSKPLIGVGIGTFMFNFKRFLATDYPFGPFYAHNCYLQMAAEIGIIGLISFLAILVLFFTFGIEAVSFKKRNFYWYILLGSMASVIGYAIQMAVDTNFYSLDLGILFWMILGLGQAALKGTEEQKDN